MPHVIVKLWPGKSEQKKKKLAVEITKAVMATLHYGEESVSVARRRTGRESLQPRHPQQA
jgi:4-oxalocrotonate tautomerase